jgi:hypothetical protein
MSRVEIVGILAAVRRARPRDLARGVEAPAETCTLACASIDRTEKWSSEKGPRAAATLKQTPRTVQRRGSRERSLRSNDWHLQRTPIGELDREQHSPGVG